MPKDDFDFEDPFELNGMAFLTREDTTNDMAECFIEEFMRMGYNSKQVLALFRNPQYIGPHMVLEKRGEPFVRDLIAEIFTRWGKPVAVGILPAVEPGVPPGGTAQELVVTSEVSTAIPDGKTPTATDPMGAPIPEFNL